MCICSCPGCTDATANNYNTSATSDDGSCMYDVTFTVDLSCESFTPGYVAATGPSDGWSCGTYALTDGDANGVWEGTFSMPAGTFEYIYCADGWAQSEAAALLASGTASGDWSCTPVTDYCSFANRLITVGAITTTDTWGTCSPCIAPVYGCTDPSAANYNISANIEDGSCAVNLFFSEYAEGSSNNKYLEIYNPTADTVYLSDYAYPSVSNAPSTAGVYEFWNSFDAGAVILPNDVYIVAHGSSDPLILAESDETHPYLSNGDDGYALVYGANPGSPVDALTGGYVILDFIGDWNGDPGSGWSVAGVSNATKDHTLVRKCDVTQGNSDWTLSAGTDAVNSEWTILPQNDWSDLGFFTTCSSITYGCIDSTAVNYNASATIDDGSCIASITGCTDSSAFNYDILANTDDGSCIATVTGCTDTSATNYDVLANTGDGSCTYLNLVYGCTDSTAFNYDISANTDDGSCIDVVYGCMDNTQFNFNVLANTEIPGSCVPFIYGCTDSTAI